MQILTLLLDEALARGGAGHHREAGVRALGALQVVIGAPGFSAARVVLKAFGHAPKHVQRDPRRRLDDSSERMVADHEHADR
jgi:hypothetical protein